MWLKHKRRVSFNDKHTKFSRWVIQNTNHESVDYIFGYFTNRSCLFLAVTLLFLHYYFFFQFLHHSRVIETIDDDADARDKIMHEKAINWVQLLFYWSQLRWISEVYAFYFLIVFLKANITRVTGQKTRVTQSHVVCPKKSTTVYLMIRFDR